MKKILLAVFYFTILFVGFGIQAEGPSIVVTSPNDSHIALDVGKKLEIRWMSPNISSALNEIYISDGIHKGHTETVRMENYLGSVIYTLDSNLIPGSNYKAYVSTAYGSAVSVSGSSEHPFTIKAVAPASSIIVLSPNGRESYKAGDKMNVKWISSLPDMGGYAGGLEIRILIKNGDSILKDVTTADDGQESMEIPSLAPGNYVLEIGSTYDSSGGSHYTKYNTAQFTIISSSTTNPSITVLSPNGGESYTDGQQITVRWTSNNISVDTPVNLILTGYDSAGNLIMNSLLSQNIILNDGSEILNLNKIPTYTGINFGKYFKIQIGDNKGMGVLDSSDNYFTIKAVTHASAPSIVVTSPNDSHIALDVGKKLEIRWMSPNISSALNEIYISDGIHKGHTETVRMENYLGSVIYTLDSNLIPGSNYKAYVSTAYGSAVSVSGSSEHPFTIRSAEVKKYENVITTNGQMQTNTFPVNLNENQGNTNDNKLIENQNNSNDNKVIESENKVDNNVGGANDHQSTVSLFVKSLLEVADREQGGIGEQVKVIAQQQDESKNTIADSINKIQTRSSFKTFLIGTDYKNVGQLRSEIDKTENNINELKGLVNDSINSQSKIELENQTQILEQEKQKISDFLKTNESKFSLFGWLVKLFN